MQDRREDLLGRDKASVRQRFVDWTFERELDQIEEFLSTLDRHAPTSDIKEAREQIAFLSIVNECRWMDEAFPTFRGRDMHWWADCRSLAGDAGCKMIAASGIEVAIEAWIAAEHKWFWGFYHSYNPPSLGAGFSPCGGLNNSVAIRVPPKRPHDPRPGCLDMLPHAKESNLTVSRQNGINDADML